MFIRLEVIMEKKKNKEKAIMDAALKFFREKGIDKTSIRDIMNGSGLGLGTFYLYFNDKNSLEEKIVLDILTDLIYKAEVQCKEENASDRYISFVSFLIDELLKDPLELELISKNANWALYAKVENDSRFEEAENTLKFILNRFDSLFNVKLSESEQIFIISLTFHIVLSTCKSSLNEDSVLTIDEMKPILFKILEKIFR